MNFAILLGLACVWRRAPEPEADPLVPLLVEADKVWQARAEPGGLERGIAAYEALLATPDARVLVRVARAHWTAGVVAAEPLVAEEHLEIARGYAMQCLLTYSVFAGAVESARWRVTDVSVQALPPRAAGCLTWAAASSVSLVRVRGPGAALEIEAARPLAERAYALAPDGELGMVAWAAGMAIVLDADPERSAGREARLPEARAMLDRAVALSPGNLLLRVDLAWAFPEASASVLPLPVEDLGGFGLENATARRLAATLPASAGR